MKAPRAMTTMIGSMPHTDANLALDKILQTVPEAPIWPQLPKLSWREGFLPQYAGGLPGLLEIPEKGLVKIDTEADLSEDLAAFYEAAMSAPETGDFSRFEISSDASSGIPAAIARFSALSEKPEYVKVHCTGGISFALTVSDKNDRALYFDDTFSDVILQNVIMKARYQIRLFKDLGKQVICFMDEPSLSAFGSSAYINVTRKDVIDKLSQMIDAIHQEGAIAGVHVCGNSDWTLLIESGADIVNFDAYGYGEAIAVYSSQVEQFLKNGGALAWGIVPTSIHIFDETAKTLEERLNRAVSALVAQNVDEELIWQQSILTPSCGMGTMSIEEAELVMDRLFELAQIIQARIR